MNLARLQSPCAIVDLDILERNAEVMITRACRLGVALRPHVKTHKCVEAARLQLGHLPARITVSTLAEARFFAEAGFEEITYAVPLGLHRTVAAVELAAKVPRLDLLLDHEVGRRRLEDAARRRGIRARVLLKVDSGLHRAGVDPERPDSVALAHRIASSDALELVGVLTHAGQSYACRDLDAVRRVARTEREVLRGFSDRLRADGLAVDTVSIGSTPTVAVADTLPGVTEIRPGNYLFHDVFQATLGSCGLEDIAFSVLGTVIGSYPERNTVVLDTGGTALSQDVGPRHIDPDCGFGVVRHVDGREIGGRPRIARLGQEHAVVPLPAGAGAALGLGTRVRVLPNHSCMAAALFERYHVVRGTEVVDVWRPCKGW